MRARTANPRHFGKQEITMYVRAVRKEWKLAADSGAASIKSESRCLRTHLIGCNNSDKWDSGWHEVLLQFFNINIHFNFNFSCCNRAWRVSKCMYIQVCVCMCRCVCVSAWRNWIDSTYVHKQLDLSAGVGLPHLRQSKFVIGDSPLKWTPRTLWSALCRLGPAACLASVAFIAARLKTHAVARLRLHHCACTHASLRPPTITLTYRLPH